MKNGFTLVELLGVIIILALITAIVVPVVRKTVNNSTSAIDKYSSEKYIDAVEQAVLEKNLNEKFKPSECTINTDGNLNCDDNILEINADGKKPDGGKISFESRDVIKAYLTYGDKTLGMQRNGEFILLKEPKSFAEDSWDTIAANVIAGNLSKYKVGDTKEITLTGFTNEEENSNGLYTIRIANTSTPEECSTSGFSQTACGFVIEFEDIITTHAMNSTDTNVGGYPASAMYTYIQNDIYNALPEELRNNIIPTTVVFGHGSKSGENNFTTTDKLYLLSTAEIWKQGTSNQINYDTARDVTRQLDYYSNLGVTTNNYSGAIKNRNGTARYWWLRSAYSNSTRYFYCVRNSGNWYYGNDRYTLGVSVAFRIG